MTATQISTRTLVLQRTQQPQEQKIRIIRNNQWAWVRPSELTDDEKRFIYVSAFQIYG